MRSERVRMERTGKLGEPLTKVREKQSRRKTKRKMKRTENRNSKKEGEKGLESINIKKE